MCVRTTCDESTGVPFIVAGFDNGSVLVWESRQPKTELTSLKLFSDPGVYIYSQQSQLPTLCVCTYTVCTVMCLALDDGRLSGVCGSPANSLEVFSLSREKVSK